MLDHGDTFRSPGGSFQYTVQGPVCRLYDRTELPWPSCSLAWKGKQPSWNRIGRRFVGDIACKRFPSYAITGSDRWGNTWTDVVTDFTFLLPKAVRKWWYHPVLPDAITYPAYPSER